MPTSDVLDATDTPPQVRRAYRLTPAGLEALRASANRVRPWTRSTGPRTPAGKARARMNATTHGERSAAAAAMHRELTQIGAMLREWRRAAADTPARLNTADFRRASASVYLRESDTPHGEQMIVHAELNRRAAIAKIGALSSSPDHAELPRCSHAGCRRGQRTGCPPLPVLASTCAQRREASPASATLADRGAVHPRFRSWAAVRLAAGPSG